MSLKDIDLVLNIISSWLLVSVAFPYPIVVFDRKASKSSIVTRDPFLKFFILVVFIVNRIWKCSDFGIADSGYTQTAPIRENEHSFNDLVMTFGLSNL